MKEKYYVVADTITRWKYDNKFENWLGYRADKSELWKRSYLLYYKVLDAKYYWGGVKLADKIIAKYLPLSALNEDSHIDKNWLKRDMIYSLHRFGASFEEYFIYQFYDRNALGRTRYNTLKMHYGYCQLVNGRHVRELFEDKGICYKSFSKFYKRDLLIVYGAEQEQDFVAFAVKHSSFIVKPYNGHSGMGIHILKDVSAANVHELFASEIAHGAFVAEELILQGEAMAKMHPESINTLRIATFAIDKSVTILGAAMRIGTGASAVDNAGAGGIYASVDVEHGFVNSVARDNLGHVHSVHPDTKVRIPGFDIPEWDKALELVRSMAVVARGATVIAWDLAYSDKGWLMVEGNDVGEPYLLQAPNQKGIKHKVISLIDKYLANAVG